MILTDRNFNTSFFEIAGGGDPILFQHLFLKEINYNWLYILVGFAILNNKLFNSVKLKYEILENKSFKFDTFFKKYKDIYPNLKQPSNRFLEWFIGFSEGEGSFILAKRGDLSFVITQSTTDIQTLNYIKNTLGFGKVIRQSVNQNTHRFVVQDIKNLVLICLIFNGNMVFPTINARFVTFLSSFNEKLLKKNLDIIIPINSCIIPSLKDSWISGITDGEGSFTCSLLSNSNSFIIRYILTQKWEANKYVLEHIMNIFNKNLAKGSIVSHFVNNVWEFRVNGVKNCKGLFSYFDEFNLITKKKNSYDKWKLLHARLINGDHLNNDLRYELIILAKKINKNL